jgi:manganese/zinc/iron transport system permease protein
MSAAAARPLAPVPRRQPLRWTQGAALAVYVAVGALVAAAGLEYVTRPISAIEQRDLSAPLWTMLVGITCNSTCAILGCYLVLRRMSLLGDAISHAVLPGIVLGYLFSGSLVGLPIFLGALAVGVLTSVLTQGISSLGRVPEDTSLGVVFTSLFAVGVVLVSIFGRNVDLDIDCVLSGLIDFAGVDLVRVLGWEVSRPLVTLVPALVVTLALVLLLWKEFKIVSFDPALAAAMGLRVMFIHYLLMTMVAGVVVASFEAVGSILVVAMLIVPAASAALLTDRLGWMMAWAVALGASAAVFGYLLAVMLATSVAGMMAAMTGVQFAAAVFLAPRQGLVSRWVRNKNLAVRIAGEDVLARLYRVEERARGSGFGVQGSGGRGQESEAGGQNFVAWLARWSLRRQGLITRAGQLTDRGRVAARSLVRAHRLWETYLDTHFDLPRDHLHDAAERMEHFLGAELQEEIAAELELPAVDPHGKAIPESRPQ